MKNRFNRLTSKEWLPFQKSWFRFDNTEKLYRENIRFFISAEPTGSVVSYHGENPDTLTRICKEENREVSAWEPGQITPVQFAIIDLREEINEATTLTEYEKIRTHVIDFLRDIYARLEHRRFISILIPNIQQKEKYFPFAWDLAKHIATFYSLKDEKIACVDNKQSVSPGKYFSPTQEVFYCLYFRKDEKSAGVYAPPEMNLLKARKQEKSGITFQNVIPAWFILKPQPRKKNEILHPAKYPEALVEMFINEFTKESDNVFDPMSGTGSTQVGALKLQRQGYGTELSDFFADIANGRCSELLIPSQKEMFSEEKSGAFKILNKDARLITDDDFPPLHYMMTSPPYWDMLNMKGAENQAKRVKKGLQTNYSENTHDLGNVADYQAFLAELVAVYNNIIDHLEPGSYLTIVVKNIKKKGSNYPFAWDLSNELQNKLILLPEVFWCQDDISIAPYGYGNTFVSNTFHQYCLNFQKPF